MLEGFEIKQRVGRVADAINEILGGDGTVGVYVMPFYQCARQLMDVLMTRD